MSRNPFWDELEPEKVEPINPFLYPEKLEERAAAEEDDDAPRRRRGRPKKK